MLHCGSAPACLRAGQLLAEPGSWLVTQLGLLLRQCEAHCEARRNVGTSTVLATVPDASRLLALLWENYTQFNSAYLGVRGVGDQVRALHTLMEHRAAAIGGSQTMLPN